ncbi:HAD family hydrolase [Pseudaestuariivita atlantica]|uniref:Haloacid dehalogenase n=1 Tax=Pseudaestuariivita atlantica TaxID=1317121 RepID=A0A0L1JNC9_9RHOB|nr:HAD family phosphatase [Pseudaestuariivita atlantica]KNG93217.1 haloacid dehalogenase [Pseudaestuariivita atlantica]
MHVTAVVFDIGNVLIDWQPERHYDAVIGADRRRALFNAIDLHDMNNDIDKGADFHARVAEEAARHPAWHAEVMMWHDDWLKLAGPPIPRSVRLLRALRAKGVPCLALSNFGIGTFEIAEAEWPFLAEFDQRFISGHMALVKPDPRIYAAVEEESGHAPGGLLFADDRAENVAAAQARGWQTHLFDGPDGFAARLVDDGILSMAEAA